MSAPAAPKAQPKKRASSFDPKQPRDALGRWRPGDPKPDAQWTNLRSNAGSPASFSSGKKDDPAALRARAKQSSRPSSRANSVVSVKSVPENSELSPDPPSQTIREATDTVQRFDMSLQDTPQRGDNDSLMDEMQQDLDRASSLHSGQSGSPETSVIRSVAKRLLDSAFGSASNPYEAERRSQDGPATEEQNAIPDLPFTVSADANPAAQSASAVQSADDVQASGLGALTSDVLAKKNEPAGADDVSKVVRTEVSQMMSELRAEFKETLQLV